MCRIARRVLNAHKAFPLSSPHTPNVAFLPPINPTTQSLTVPKKISARVWPDFLSQAEEKIFYSAVESKLSTIPLLKSHHDGVIFHYKEYILDNSTISKEANNIVEKVQNKIFADDTKVKTIHVLELGEEGYIFPHLDTNLTGGIVAGLCLLSDAVITLQPYQEELFHKFDSERRKVLQRQIADLSTKEHPSIVQPEQPRVELLLPARSLYILTSEARYDWTHGIEVPKFHSFNHKPVARTRRISVIFRDALPESETDSFVKFGVIREEEE